MKRGSSGMGGFRIAWLPPFQVLAEGWGGLLFETGCRGLKMLLVGWWPSLSGIVAVANGLILILGGTSSRPWRELEACEALAPRKALCVSWVACSHS